MRADCHIHMVLDGIDWKASIARGVADGHIRRVLEDYQKKGYTYLRDGGDRWGVGLRAKVLARDYEITYRTPLAPLCLQGHYGSFIGLVYENPRDYARLVQQQRTRGADFVKIMVSGLMDFDRCGVLTEPPLEDRLITELIHIAHEEGMSVMAHCNGTRPALAAAAAGVDSIEHGAYLEDEALHAMVQMGVVWVPTLSTVGNLRNTDRYDERSVEMILENTMLRVEKFRNLGGFIAPGTDAGAWAVPHGCQTEEKLLAQAGVGQENLQRGIEIIKSKF